MSTLSWNCRGLGQPRTVQELTRLVREFCPNIIFLSETRQQANRVSNIKFSIGMNICFVVDGHGKGGGLALYCDDSIKIEILLHGLHHIDTLIRDGDHHAGWRRTFIYGEPRAENRHLMWELIRRIKPRSQAPWLMIGDFNEALWSFEHFSARRRPERQMLDFKEVLSHCDLHDLGFVGRPWTFDNKQAGDRNVRVRLDRAVASPSWAQWFPAATLKHIATSRSDHCPILLCTDQANNSDHGRHIFHYEIMWEREETLPEEIEKAWNAGAPIQHLGDIASTLGRAKVPLRSWSQKKFGVVTRESKCIRQRVEEIESQSSIADQCEINTLRHRMDELLYREETMWLQCLRIAWLKDGDRNTKYFHKKAAGRAKKNKIKHLRKDNGEVTKDKTEMEIMARNFFKELYQADP
jgi:hypothetical protein